MGYYLNKLSFKDTFVGQDNQLRSLPLINQFADVREYFKASLETSEYANSSNIFFLTAAEITEQLLYRCERLLEQLHIDEGQNCPAIEADETSGVFKQKRPEGRNSDIAEYDNQIPDSLEASFNEGTAIGLEQSDQPRSWPSGDEVELESAMEQNDGTYLEMTMSTNQKSTHSRKCKYCNVVSIN